MMEAFEMAKQLVHAFVLYICVSFGTSIGFVLVRLYAAYRAEAKSWVRAMLGKCVMQVGRYLGLMPTRWRSHDWGYWSYTDEDEAVGF
jgi:hypothetical protein